jgi:hypothetical protein
MSTAIDNFTQQLHDNLEAVEARAKSLRNISNLYRKKLKRRFNLPSTQPRPIWTPGNKNLTITGPSSPPSWRKKNLR